ncbi:MAG: hypothetical protein A2Z25_01260 [Planctomycetes bacterium RBG_16_55_9]|nr:MAG: hypothetical protein A2Z25_01260 [Planctomycetes bacterium RBG_16_55_9]
MRKDERPSEPLSRLRRRAEQKARRDFEALRDQPPGKTQELMHELQVHQIELEMQNEELRRAQLELEELRLKYFDLFNLAPVGYFTFDLNGLILEANLTGAALLGTTKSHSLKRSFSHWIAPESRDTFYLHRQETLKTGAAQTCELILKRSDGREFSTELVSRVELDEKGRFKQFRTTVQDISERKKAEHELLEYQKKLKAMTSQLSSIQERERRELAMQLHDRISQRLAILKLQLETAVGSLADTEAAGKIRDVAKQVGGTMEDAYLLMLELSNPVLYEIGLEAAVDALLRTDLVRSCGIECKLIAPEHLLNLETDVRVAIYQAVRELLGNAIKHSMAKQIEVHLHGTRDAATATVEDDGIGFNPSDVRPRGKGGGFGLFNIRESIEGRSGQFTIESKPGKGTSATVCIPLPRKGPPT